MAAFAGWQHKSRDDDDDDDDNHNHRAPDSDDEDGGASQDAFSHYNQYAQYMKQQQAKANGAGGSGSASGAAAAGAGAGAGADAKRTGGSTPKAAAAVDISKLDAAGKKALAEKRKTEGNEFFKTGEYSTATDLYTQCIQLCPEDATYYGNRAAAYLMDKKYQSALTDALKAISLDPKAEKSYNRAAKCYQAFGEFDKSREMLDRLIALTPAPNAAKADGDKLAAAQADAKKELRILESLKFKLTKVNELLAAGSSTEALMECETLMGYCPEANAVRALLADALIGCRKYDQARALLNSLYNEEKSNIQVIVLRGIALLYTGNVANALKHFQESLRMDPDNKRGMQMFKKVKAMEQKKEAGNKAFTDGRAQEAIDLYTEALAVDPVNEHYNATLYNNRAAAFMKANNFSAAVADCSRCIDLAPDNVKAHLRRAKCHGELNNWDEALRDFERAQKLDPQNEDIQRDIRQAKLEQKKAKRKDYYKIMGISKHAQLPEIKKAFRSLSLKHHPDRVTDTEGKKKAEVVFKEITEAYECLSDPKRKQRYDSGQDIEEEEGYGHGHGPDMSNIVRMFFGGGGMGGMGGRGGHSHGGGFGGGGFGF